MIKNGGRYKLSGKIIPQTNCKKRRLNTKNNLQIQGKNHFKMPMTFSTETEQPILGARTTKTGGRKQSLVRKTTPEASMHLISYFTASLYLNNLVLIAAIQMING